ncbi:hypothetical protein H0H93_006961, partial [Arthromyces matolae]
MFSFNRFLLVALFVSASSFNVVSADMTAKSGNEPFQYPSRTVCSRNGIILQEASSPAIRSNFAVGAQGHATRTVAMASTIPTGTAPAPTTIRTAIAPASVGLSMGVAIRMGAVELTTPMVARASAMRAIIVVAIAQAFVVNRMALATATGVTGATVSVKQELTRDADAVE